MIETASGEGGEEGGKVPAIRACGPSDPNDSMRTRDD